MRTAEERVLTLASTQHGHVSIGQARRLGMTEHQVRHRMTDGRWLQVFRGVYRMAGQPVTFRGSAAAALLAAGPLGMISHCAAAVVWEVRGAMAGQLHLTVPRGGIRRLPGVEIHGPLRFPGEEVRVVDGLRVTGPALTLLDYAAQVDADLLETAVHDVLFRGLACRPELEKLLAAPGRGRHGTAALRAVLAEMGTGAAAESELEVRFLRRVVRRHGLPTPVAQHEVRVGGRRYRIDFAYLGPRVAIELDGGRWHGEADRSADVRRDLKLEEAGWRVLHLSWPDVHRRPELCAERIAGLIHTRTRAS